MKTKIYFLAFISLSILFVLPSCSDDDKNDDTTKPTITLESPAEGESLKIGSDVHFEVVFEDNDKLASYKVDIHNNFDGHSHGSAKAEDETATVPFTFNKSWKDIAGQKQASVHHHEIIIPENATPGNYHFMVYCLDASGNESYVARNVVLSHDAEEHDHDHDHE